MRRFLHDLAMLAAVSAAGGFALMRIPSPRVRSPVDSTPVADVGSRSKWDEAVHTLRTASTFASASVGYGGVVPDAVVAWRTVVAHPMGVRIFLELLHSSTPEGRMYALAGLRALDVSGFLSVAAAYRGDRSPVNAMVGCIGFTASAGDLLYELDHGMWIGEFIAAKRSRYFGDLPWPGN
jgi:hypothetical protein